VLPLKLATNRRLRQTQSWVLIVAGLLLFQGALPRLISNGKMQSPAGDSRGHRTAVLLVFNSSIWKCRDKCSLVKTHSPWSYIPTTHAEEQSSDELLFSLATEFLDVMVAREALVQLQGRHPELEAHPLHHRNPSRTVHSARLRPSAPGCGAIESILDSALDAWQRSSL
jgi:hypothetical protein